MTKSKIEKQMEANKKWADKNPEHKKYLSYRSTARTFARKHANEEDMKELIEIYKTENENSKKD